MRTGLIERVRDVLAQAGYYLSQDSPLRPVSFDLVARRDSQLLLVKVLTNVDSLTDSVAGELRVLAEFLDAKPLLLGERSSSRPLEPGVMYARHGVPIMTVETLQEFLLQGVPPLVFAAPGGFYVTLDGARLKRVREERGLSLGQLAEVAGVSRRAISMYEEGMGAMVDVAERLEDFLNEPLVVPVDPFRERFAKREVVADVERLQEGIEREVMRHLVSLGFRIAPIERGPFQGMAKEERVILTGVGDQLPELARKARAVANLCEVAETFGVFFVERRTTTRVAVEGLPLVSVDELARLDDAQKVVSLLEERRRQKR